MSTVATTAPASPDDEGHRAVVQWLKPDGATVAVGTAVCEVASTRATRVIESVEAGILRHGVPDGATFAVGDVVFRVDPPPP